ncbi:MAG: DUF4388 domain-containing protein [Nitrospirae bacterium]|nr:DUF4388 domain-containing protein [Nitrospirota bacterium]
MALEGSLKDFGLADIFQLIYIQKKTGILKMKNVAREAKVLFENGLVVTADSSNLEGMNKIGEGLLRTGRISEDQLKIALVTQRKTNEKIGVILVEMGAVVKEDLIKALGLHVKEAIFNLFQWKEGFYSFEPTDISYQHDYWLPINTEFLIMEGVRRIDEWPYIEKKIPNLDLVFEKIKENEDKVKLARSEEDSLDDMFGEPKKDIGIQITQEEMGIYSLIDGQQNVRQLIDTANIGEFETCKALSNLLTAGLIVQKSAGEPKKMDPDKAGRARRIIPILSVRQILSGLFLILCLVFWGSSSGKFVGSIDQMVKASGLYHEFKTANQLKQTGFSVLSYYYRYNRLPESLELLNVAGYPAGFIIASEGSAVVYEPDILNGSFSIRVQD